MAGVEVFYDSRVEQRGWLSWVGRVHIRHAWEYKTPPWHSSSNILCKFVSAIYCVYKSKHFFYGSLFMYSVISIGHRHFHTDKCNVPTLPRKLLEHHKAIITYVSIFLLCSCGAIYLLLTSFDRSLNRPWSCEVKHWITLHVPSVGMHNLGQRGPSTYGCHIKFYIIGSDRAMRRSPWKWIDI